MVAATESALLARSIDRLRGRAVLMLDSDASRLRARSDAMQSRGANVTCSTTANRARALWKPGSHFLVLIELGGAGADFEEFHRFAARLHGDQAFAFYTSQPPYLTAAVPSSAARNVIAEPPQAPAAGAAPSFAGNIAEASQRIAAIRPLARSVARRPNEVRPGSFSFSQAVKAAERVANDA
jgi:hypothetical protein